MFTNGLTFSASNGLVTSSTLTLAANGATQPVVSVTAGNSTIGSVITGTGFAKQGTSSLTLTGANTYSGTTTINAGSLIVNNGSAASSGPIVINGTAGNQRRRPTFWPRSPLVSRSGQRPPLVAVLPASAAEGPCGLTAGG